MTQPVASVEGQADRERIRFGIRAVLAVSAILLMALTMGLAIYAYLALDHLQARMEELADGNIEEIALARRLRDSTEALLRPLAMLAERPGEVPTSATLANIHAQLTEVRGHTVSLSARLADFGTGADQARMQLTEAALGETERAVAEVIAAARRRSLASDRCSALLHQIEQQLARHFDAATRVERELRVQTGRTLAGEGGAQRDEELAQRELAWLGTAQDLRGETRTLLSMVYGLEREADPSRLPMAQRQVEAQAQRLLAWRTLPDNDGVRRLGLATDELLATLSGDTTLSKARAEGLAAEAAMAGAARHAAHATARFSGEVRELGHRLGHDVRDGIRQTRQEVQRMQRMLTGAALVATLVSVLLVYTVVARRVIRPLERITLAMREAAAALSADQPGWQAAALPAETAGSDEIAAMYRALRVFRDTLLRREEALQHSEAQLKTILRTIHEGIQLWDTDGRLVYGNAAASHYFGVGAGQAWAEANRDWQYLHEDGSTFALPELPHLRALKSGSVQNGTVMLVINPGGVRHWLLVNAQPVIGGRPDEILGIVTSCSDISEFKLHQSELEYLAHHDPLTQLPNRTLLEDRLEHAIAQADRNGTLLAVCYLDLDGFKPINDCFGHAAGDLLLREVAARLKANLRGGDTVARLGGDEFALLLCDLGDTAEGLHTLERVLESIGTPCVVEPETRACARITASIGVTLYPRDPADANGLLRHADHAMYLAKQSGKNAFRIFDPEPPPAPERAGERALG